MFLLAPSIGRAAILCHKLEAVLSRTVESEEAQDLSTFFSVTLLAQIGVNEYQDMLNHFATEFAGKEQLQTLHADANFAVMEANRKGTGFILAPLKALSKTAEDKDKTLDMDNAIANVCGADKVSKDGSLIEVKKEATEKAQWGDMLFPICRGVKAKAVLEAVNRYDEALTVSRASVCEYKGGLDKWLEGNADYLSICTSVKAAKPTYHHITHITQRQLSLSSFPLTDTSHTY